MATKAARAAANTAKADITLTPGNPQADMTVKLLGVEYLVTPPKVAMALNVARLASDDTADPLVIMDALDRWITKAFGDRADEVRKRMYEDENDDLDFFHIVELIKKLIEKQTGNPTT